MNKKRTKVGDANAIYSMGCGYDHGLYGMPQDHNKALEFWHRAGKLGHSLSYYYIANSYCSGRGVEMNAKKAGNYYELAAIGGDATARHNLGVIEYHAGNMDRAMKHYMIAVGVGYTESLENIKQLFMAGYATKDDYAKALCVYQANLVEIKSPQRDEAAVFSDFNRCY